MRLPDREKRHRLEKKVLFTNHRLEVQLDPQNTIINFVNQVLYTLGPHARTRKFVQRAIGLLFPLQSRRSTPRPAHVVALPAINPEMELDRAAILKYPYIPTLSLVSGIPADVLLRQIERRLPSCVINQPHTSRESIESTQPALPESRRSGACDGYPMVLVSGGQYGDGACFHDFIMHLDFRSSWVYYFDPGFLMGWYYGSHFCKFFFTL